MNNLTQVEIQPTVKATVGLFFAEGPKQLAASAKNIPFLTGLSDQALAALMSNAQTKSYSKHATILSEGDVAGSFFIILSGKVRVFIGDDKGKQVTLSIHQAGEYFGEEILLLNELRSVSVIALEGTSCAVITKSAFICWLIKFPDAAFSLLGVLSENIRQLTDKVKQVTLLNVYERTVTVLKGLAVDEGNISVIHNKPTQQELACMVGASRESVNKIMQGLTKGGYVGLGDKAIIINKKLPSAW